MILTSCIFAPLYMAIYIWQISRSASQCLLHDCLVWETRSWQDKRNHKTCWPSKKYMKISWKIYLDGWKFSLKLTLNLVKHLGPVVQSIISLMSSLVVKMLTVLVRTISDSLVFFQQKCLHMPYLMTKVFIICLLTTSLVLNNWAQKYENCEIFCRPAIYKSYWQLPSGNVPTLIEKQLLNPFMLL